jgi:peptide-methionine (S)-S-oxide reductase
MGHSPSLDDAFRAAVSAIDAGDVSELSRQIAAHPALLSDRLDTPGSWLRDKVGNALDNFFQRPYLLWFVAEDPVRNGTLPSNIAEITLTIIRAAQRAGVASLGEQLDYALRLVSWSWIARQCNVQIALIDVLVDAGASPEGNPDNALVNSNFAAAAHLVDRGAPLTLSTALCLERWDDVDRLATDATLRQKQCALTLVALKGKPEALRRILALGVDVNKVSEDLYSHASPLHHAVSSGSLEAVEILVGAGADLDARDTAYDGTPLDWAEYSGDKPQYDAIAAYLRRAETDRRSPRR